MILGVRIPNLSLVADTTPKQVQKAVEEGKLAMRSASMISKLPEKEQEAIAKESMKRKTGRFLSKIKKEMNFVTDKQLADFIKLDQRRVGEFLRFSENIRAISGPEAKKD